MNVNHLRIKLISCQNRKYLLSICRSCSFPIAYRTDACHNCGTKHETIEKGRQ